MVNPDGVSISQLGLDGVQTDAVRRIWAKITGLVGLLLLTALIWQLESQCQRRRSEPDFTMLCGTVMRILPDIPHQTITKEQLPDAIGAALIQLTLQQQFTRTIIIAPEGDVIY